MTLNIGLGAEQREGVVELLSALLADEYVLYTKTRNYHWNVVGPQFNELHKFFQDQYEALDDVVDEVAERARTLGGHAIGTLAEFVQLTRLEEHPAKYPEAREMLANLLGDHEAVIRTLRRDLETAAEPHRDMGTNDFLTGLMERHEKMAWMLRAFLEGRSS
ncbi:MAG TPA: DNA starvation/stationary phase protection protein [Methylomirabilota bacterium]|jgi:starvation-inducible DNA-binding protein|nr:DNA starvation/stationary phase protection protein [Methylomirabilota bacterium]